MGAHRGAAFLVDIRERNLYLARAVQHHLLDVGGQVFERGVGVEVVERRQALQHLEVELVAAVPALDRARGQRQVGEGHHAPGIEEGDLAQPVAARARAHGVVEREQPRLQLLQRVRADRAGKARAEGVLLAAIHLQRQRAAVGQPQRGLERLGQALLDVGAHLHAVDHHVDAVLLGLLQLGQLVDLIHPGLGLMRGAAARADAEAHEALRLHAVEQVRVLALAVDHHRRQDHQLGVLRQRQRRIHHLRHALRLQRQVVVGAVGRAGAGVQEAQVVVDLGHRAHGGARVVAGGLLLDADGGRQALDHIDIGLVHELQELPRIGREAFHVAPLPLGIQRVERQARLARARQAGDHHQLVARDVEIDVLQVVGARAADADALLGEQRAKVGVAFRGVFRGE
ncbi:hypothetical protein D3C72_976790 [compost metagenome]